MVGKAHRLTVSGKCQQEGPATRMPLLRGVTRPLRPNSLKSLEDKLSDDMKKKFQLFRRNGVY